MFQQKSKVAKAEKAIEAEATFSVALSKKDKTNRDQAKTTIYHTGEGRDMNNWAAPQEKQLAS